ncbi:hypothetical protein CTAYLR_000245, partial [Chrysophaeum taylorii]
WTLCHVTAEFRGDGDPRRDELVLKAEVVSTTDDAVRLRFRYTQSNKVMSFADFIYDCNTENFGSWFGGVLARTPFPQFYFECAPVARATVARPFECSIVRARTFAPASPDAFASHFVDATKLAVTFTNMGGDATLIAPTTHSRVPREANGHIAAFCREAPATVLNEFWRQVGAAFKEELARKGRQRRTWLSTAGNGVPWLHARLDSRPKYYHTQEYIAYNRKKEVRRLRFRFAD